MSRFNPHHDSERVYEATRIWKEACLLGDGSALAPGNVLWTADHLDELDRRYVRNLDAGEGNFLGKLSGQLEGASSEAKRLMAELLWVLLLFPSNVGSQSKRQTITQVWSWSGTEPPLDSPMLSDQVLDGLGSGGPGYLAHRWRELVFLVTLIRTWRAQTEADRQALLADGWSFAEWLAQQPDAANRQLTHMLPHLLFPDLFERISSGNDKVGILGAFTPDARKVWEKRSFLEVDRALLDLRTRLEEEAGRQIDFYEDDLKPRWRPADPPVPPTDDGTKAEEGDAPLVRKTISRTGALNSILFGPPGTGKTYATMREAVAICDGQLQADRLKIEDLRTRYETLRDAGRIAFVTFHQSFSYEDFVEGLRPETETQDGAGFRLVPRPGLLRQMADLAAKGRSALPSGESASLDGRGIFKMSLGRANYDEDAYIYEECLEGGYVLLGYGGNVDWSPERFSQWSNILAEWQTVDASATGYNPNVTSIWSFRNDMKVGDLVVVSNGNHKFRAIGEVTGNYEFIERATDDDYRHRRQVRWLWNDPDGLPASAIIEGQFSMRSVYRIAGNKVKAEALAAYLAPPQAAEHLPHVLVIDEINRANVSKVFGELITLLEEDKRAGAANAITVRLPYSGEAFTLPSNLHILGTMNTADRSIALLDTALRRRFSFVEMSPQPSLLGIVDGLDLKFLLTRLNERIEWLFDRDHLIGHAFFMTAATRAQVDEVMRRKVIPLLQEYFHEDWEKVVAVLGGAQQGFIERVKLSPPPGFDEGGEPRHRYRVRASFPEDAYAGLQE